jgi:hypothetical protein
MFWHLDRNRPVHFVLAAEVAGRTTLKAWDGALRATQRRHPLLSCPIRSGEDGQLRWHQGSSPIPLRIVRGRTMPDWGQEIERELSSPFSPEQAPLVRAVLIQAGDKSVLLMAAHHSVADGLSLVYVIRDVLRSHNGEALETNDFPPSQEERIEATVPPAASTAADDRPPSAQPSGPATFRSSDGATPWVRRLRLSPELTRKLHRRARREGTTVHAALGAAVMLTAEEEPERWGASPIRILNPINLRKLLGSREECVLSVSAGVVSAGSGPGTAFWDLARRAREDLQGARSPEGVRQATDAFSRALSRERDPEAVSDFFAQAFACEVLLTNLGKDPIETEFGPLHLEGLWGPAIPIGFEGAQAIGITTLNDSLALVHTSHTPVPSLLDSVERVLIEACD